MRHKIVAVSLFGVLTLAGLAIAQQQTAAEPPKAETAAACSACSNCASTTELTKAEIGKPAPNFALLDQHGKQHRLADYKGKVVAIVWTNPDCPFIVRHYREATLNRLASQFEGQEVALLLIDTTRRSQEEASAAAQKAAETYGHSLTVLNDLDGKVGRAFDARRTPQAYVIDQEGKLIFNGALDCDPRGQKAVAEREVYPVAAIQAALAGQTPAVQTTPPSAVYGCTVKYAQ